MIRFRYFILTLKKYIKCIPLGIVGIVMPLLIIGITFLYLSNTLYSSIPVLKGTISIVAEDIDDIYVEKAIEFLGNMQSTSDLLEFQISTMEEAQNSLEAGDSIAILRFSKEMLDGIMTGQNVSGQIMFKDNATLQTVLFRELTKAGASFLASAEAGTYTTTDLYINCDKEAYVLEAYDSIDLINFSYVLEREKAFNSNLLIPENATSLSDYYLASGIMLLILLLGVVFSKCFSKEKAAFIMQANTRHFYDFQIDLLHILAFSLIVLIFITMPIISLKLIFEKATYHFLNTALISLYISSLTLIFFRLMKTPAFSIILLVLFNCLHAFVTGAIIPLAFFPTKMATLSHYLPFSYIHMELSNMISGNSSTTAWPLLIYILINYCIILAISKCKR